MSAGMVVVYVGGLAVTAYVLFLGRGALKAWKERKSHEIPKDQQEEAEPMILTTERVKMPLPDEQDKEASHHDTD